MNSTDPWSGLLDKGEEILWQGRPNAGIRLDLSQPMMIVMGVFFMGFSLFWMSMAAQAGGFFWMFGLLFFGIGLFNSIGVHFWKAYVRSVTHYTLTDKRAFIATNILGQRRLKSYPIEPDADLELSEGTFSSVTFARNRKRGKNGYYEVPVAFEYISDGREVLRMMRQVQERQP